ncbi:MAG TPA: hypothetical protein P5262_04450 [Candidatus Moranbacteria bacterium]|nr:hypothetical protein [Candidatus Moranbacteria bacterium]
MHKKISGRLAIEIIILLAVLVGGMTIIKTSLLNFGSYGTSISIAPVEKITQAEDCTVHAYKGKAEISGWYVKSEEGEWLFAVSDGDMEKLPKYDGTEEYKTKNKQLKLIDVPSSIEKTLKKTSEKKPQTITITGYATRCEGIPLAFASLEYQDGIFKKYLNI